MNLKWILIALVLLGVGYGAYVWGWYRGSTYEAVTSAIAHGQIDVVTAQALRRHDVPEALKWVEISLRDEGISLQALDRQVPKPFTESSSHVSAAIRKYDQDNKLPPK